MASCFECGQLIPAGQEVNIPSGMSSFTVCPRCAPPGSKTAQAPGQSPSVPGPASMVMPPQGKPQAFTPPVPLAPPSGNPMPASGGVLPRGKRAALPTTDTPNVALAIILGAAAAIAASFIWYGFVAATNFQVGLVAVGIGYLVSIAVVYGSGGHRGALMQLISIGLILFAMLFSEYLLVHHYVARELAKSGEAIPAILPPLQAIVLIGLGIKSDPLTLLFWGIAVYEGWKIPRDDE